MISDATEPHELGRLLGFVDFVAIAAAAVGSVVAGAILGTVGLNSMVLISALLARLPVPDSRWRSSWPAGGLQSPW
jgi:MFS family permease